MATQPIRSRPAKAVGGAKAVARPAISVIAPKRKTAQRPPAEADERTIDLAVAEVRLRYDASQQHLTIDLGTRLQELLYEPGDAEIEPGSPLRNPSVRRLAKRCRDEGIPISQTKIWTAIQAAALTKRLPADSAVHRLGPSLVVELVSVRDLTLVEKLASEALEKGLTTRPLRALVKQHRPPARSGRGRKPEPPLIKALKRATSGLRDGDTWNLPFDRHAFEQLTETQQKGAGELLEHLVDLVEMTKKIVRSDFQTSEY